MALLLVTLQVKFGDLGLNRCYGQIDLEVGGEFPHPRPKMYEPLTANIVRDGDKAETNIRDAGCEDIVHVALPGRGIYQYDTNDETRWKQTFRLSGDPPFPTHEKADDEHS